MSTLNVAIGTLDTVSIILGMVPLVGENLKSATELASKICEQVQTIKENRQGYEQLGIQIAGLLTATASVLNQGNRDDVLQRILQANVDDLLHVLREIYEAIAKRIPSHPAPVRKRDRVSTWIRNKATDAKRMNKDADELQDMRRKLQNVIDEFTVSALLRSELNTLESGRDVNAVRDLASSILKLQIQEAERAKRDADIILLESLRPVGSAAWIAPSVAAQSAGVDCVMALPDTSASTCTPGTRVSILKDIVAWAGASDSPCVFWLNGLAGTGKSTIARTLCQHLHPMHGQRLLGASFFVSRDQPNRRDASNIVRSIAYQLAVVYPPVSAVLCSKLRETPASVPRSLQQQITDFVITPARELQNTTSFIIVIDALDECMSDFVGRPGGEFLLLLVEQLLQLNGRLRLFITSRGEVSIQNMFQQLSVAAQTVVKLQDLDTVVVQADIRTYLEHSFTGISSVRREIALDNWPLAEDVEKLVKLSGLLFIYAATAVRFVQNPKFDPRLRLVQLLGQGQQSAGASPYRQLDALYRQILSDAVTDPDGDEEILCLRLHAVVGVIILAQVPLSVAALAAVSGVALQDVAIVVGHLSSLFADSTDGVRVFHPSFPDFAIEPVRCTDSRLRVVPLVDHGTIALRCLALMNQHLRYNICSLGDHSVANDEVQGFDQLLSENVSDALRYAVCFWCTHLAASGSPEGSLLNALDNFCRRHLFHWLEVLSLVKCVPPAETALLQVINWCEKHPSDTTAFATYILGDLVRVLQVFATPIRSHALHAYHSAFVTMPKCLLLDILSQGTLPNMLPRLVSPRGAYWGPYSRVIEGHTDGVMCVTFSPDGKLIVSGSGDDTVRVWNAVTFEQLAILQGHQGGVRSVAFSFDGKCIISGSDDKTVRVWNATTFEQLSKLEGHESWINCVAFSPDNSRIVSASDDYTVRVWNAVNYDQLARLEGHEGHVTSVAFSPDGTHIISGSDDGTVRIWNAVTFKQSAVLEGHQGNVRSVAFSFDGKHVVSGSDDKTVRVWNAVTFEQFAKLDGHEDEVSSVAFSPDGRYIVSGSEDETVRFWNVVTSQQLAKFEGHEGYVRSVAFSPDGKHIISGSDDDTVRVWNPVAFEQLVKLEGHQGDVHSVAFSPDGISIISGSDDNTVRVWNAGTFKQLAQLDGHQGAVWSVAYSHDGKHIVSGSDDKTVRVWNAITFEQLAKLNDHEGEVNHVTFSPDDKRIVSASFDRTVRIWNAVTFEQLAKLESDQAWVRCIAFSPDGKHMITGSGNRTVCVWNAVTFECLAVLEGHQNWVNFVAFSPDNEVIFSRGEAGEQRAWKSIGSEGSAYVYDTSLNTLTYNADAWTELAPADPAFTVAYSSSSPQMEFTLSETGWLSCSAGPGRSALWLPIERRGRGLARYGSRVVVGAKTGALTMLELPVAQS